MIEYSEFPLTMNSQYGFKSLAVAVLALSLCLFSAQAQPLSNIQGIKLHPGLTLTGAVNSVVSIQAIDNATADNWQSLTNILIPNTPYLWIDPSHPAEGTRFYRVGVPTNLWVSLNISTASTRNILTTGSTPASFSFTFNGGSFGTSSWLRKFGYAEPGIPDDGVLSIPGAAEQGGFKVFVPSAIMITGPQGRQPLAVKVSLSPGQQQRYSKMAVLQGGAWGDGVYTATVHYDSGNDSVINLSAYDWSKPTAKAPAGLQWVATSRDTHPQFGNTIYLYSQTVPVDATRTLVSISFAVTSIIPPSGVSQADAAARFAVGILAVSAFR